MIEIITDSKLISKFQKQFVDELKTFCKEKIRCVVGYQGASEKFTVFYSEIFDFWFTSKNNYNRYWNAFGFGRPSKGQSNSITVEINFPHEGINRNIGGVFGVDKNHQIFILHRGKIGGGRIGIGKQLFFDKYRDEPIIVDDDGLETELCLIAGLKTKYFQKQVGNFVSNVHRIKNLTNFDISDFSFLKDFRFTEETAGRKKIKRIGTATIERTHGIVVNSLAKILEKKGYKTANDRNRDLFIHDRGRIKTMFEIKRSSSPQALYSAAGQLIIYSIPLKSSADLVMVLPDKLIKSVENRLMHFGIKILYYDWNDGEPLFENFTKILKN